MILEGGKNVNVPLRNRLFSIVLTLALFVGICPAAFAAPSEVGYDIEGAYNDENNTLRVAIYIHDINAVIGRIALQYDNSKLELQTNGTLAGTVTAGSGVSITKEGLQDSQLVSPSEGHVMIPWNSSSTSVNASSEKYLIASVTFQLAEGVTTDDFNRDTLRLKHIKSGIYANWTDSAYIVSRVGVGYTYSTEREDYLCNVSFHYPNAEKEPIYFYTVNIKVVDDLGEPLQARVTVGQTPVDISASGTGSIRLTPGVYTYKASLDEYETKIDSITVKDSDITKLIVLSIDQQLVEAAAAALEIGFSGTDSYNSVTSPIYLPKTGLYNTTVEWESSQPDVITSDGALIRRDEATDVVLRAKVSRKKVKAEREFPRLHVLASGNSEAINQENINADYEALEVKFAPGDSYESVTSDVKLTERGLRGSGIEWTSDREDLILSTGELLSRPQQDTLVQLTANLYRNNLQKEKVFTILIKAQKTEDGQPEETDQQIVEKVASSLKIGYTGEDNQNYVTQDLSLDTMGSEGTTIEWEADKPHVVTEYGKVVRQESDTRVVLTATISRNDASVKKVFDPILVIRKEPEPDANTDQKKFQADYEALEIGYAVGDSKDSITSDLELPIQGKNGSTIEWKSSKEDIIKKDGKVIRPEQNTKVTLTAKVSLGKLSEEKIFSGQQVIAEKKDQPPEGPASDEADKELVKKIAEALDIEYASGDASSNVTKDLTLKTVGADGCKIEWESSNEAVVSKQGKVTRPENGKDAPVTLTAVISKNNAKETKAFSITVLARSQGATGVGRPIGPDSTPQPETTPRPTASPTASPTTTPIPERFTDLESVSWAKDAIYALAEKGVIKGTSETEFSPVNPIRRGDFVALIVRMFQLESEYTSSFADVPRDSYYYPEITAAKSLGIIDGVGDNHFNPEGMITRQDMMTMTYRAMARLGKIPGDVTKDSLNFNDGGQIAEYAAEAVQVLVSMQLIQGNAENNVCPLDQTTRAEAAVFLNRIDQLNK